MPVTSHPYWWCLPGLSALVLSPCPALAHRALPAGGTPSSTLEASILSEAEDNLATRATPFTPVLQSLFWGIPGLFWGVGCLPSVAGPHLPTSVAQRFAASCDERSPFERGLPHSIDHLFASSSQIYTSFTPTSLFHCLPQTQLIPDDPNQVSNSQKVTPPPTNFVTSSMGEGKNLRPQPSTQKTLHF